MSGSETIIGGINKNKNVGVAVDGDDFVVMYNDRDDTLRLARLDASGVVLSDTLVDTGGLPLFVLSLAVGPQGILFRTAAGVAFLSNDGTVSFPDAGPTCSYTDVAYAGGTFLATCSVGGIFAQRFDDLGTPVGDLLTLVPSGLNNGGTPLVASSGNDFLVVGGNSGLGRIVGLDGTLSAQYATAPANPTALAWVGNSYVATYDGPSPAFVRISPSGIASPVQPQSIGGGGGHSLVAGANDEALIVYNRGTIESAHVAPDNTVDHVGTVVSSVNVLTASAQRILDVATNAHDLTLLVYDEDGQNKGQFLNAEGDPIGSVMALVSGAEPVVASAGTDFVVCSSTQCQSVTATGLTGGWRSIPPWDNDSRWSVARMASDGHSYLALAANLQLAFSDGTVHAAEVTSDGVWDENLFALDYTFGVTGEGRPDFIYDAAGYLVANVGDSFETVVRTVTSITSGAPIIHDIGRGAAPHLASHQGQRLLFYTGVDGVTRATRLDATGAPLDQPVMSLPQIDAEDIHTEYGAQNLTHLDLTGTPQGFRVVWSKMNDGCFDGSGDVLASEIDSSGQVGEPYPVSATDEPEENPVFAHDGRIVIYERVHLAPGYHARRIHIRKLGDTLPLGAVCGADTDCASQTCSNHECCGTDCIDGNCTTIVCVPDADPTGSGGGDSGGGGSGGGDSGGAASVGGASSGGAGGTDSGAAGGADGGMFAVGGSPSNDGNAGAGDSPLPTQSSTGCQCQVGGAEPGPRQTQARFDLAAIAFAVAALRRSKLSTSTRV
ncbi:MAG: hypothetical protein U0271_39905 [Polyangiaceae bacterium]